MAYTFSYNYDIFISYAHDDNEVFEGDTGWVTQFQDYLESWLVKRRNVKGLKIWFDGGNLRGNTDFEQEIQDGIKKSALFFVLHSHNYQESDYCRKELDWFLEENNKSPNGVKVGNQYRIFNILINNIQHTQWPENLSGNSGFILHDATEDSDYGDPTPIKSQHFGKQMKKLVDAAFDTLKQMPKEEVRPATRVMQETSDDSHKPKIFIADVADTLRPFRKRLINEIGNSAIILPSLPPPYTSQEHQAALDQTLQQSNLSIHLLDQWEGRQIDDLDGISFPRQQADTAIKNEKESLIWVPDTLNMADIEDEQQAAWLAQLENNDRQSAGFHFVRNSRQDFIEQIKQTISNIQLTTQNLEDNGTFLIDTHQKDQRFAFQLANILSDKNIDVDFNKESRDPVQSLEDFEGAVREVQNLIIMFGGVAPTWLKGRIEKTIKIVASQLGEGITTLQAIWVCLLPDSPGMHSVGNFPPLLKINLLDNTSSAHIDDSTINTLLNASNNKEQQ